MKESVELEPSSTVVLVVIDMIKKAIREAVNEERK